MLTQLEHTLLDDIGGPNGYGKVLIGWKGPVTFFMSPQAPLQPGMLTPEMARTFTESVYLLVQTARVITLYRGFESPDLTAPYGIDHPSFFLNLVTQRRPGRRDGLWWSPTRPSVMIDDLKLSAMHREEPRNNSSIK